MKVVDAVRSDVAGGQAISADALKEWLLEHDFAVANWGQGWVLERGRIQSIFGWEKEIQANISEEAGEFTELYCRFTLPLRAQPPLSEWSLFVNALCLAFELRLGDDTAPCNEQRFLAVLREDEFYRSFADALGWDTAAPC